MSDSKRPEMRNNHLLLHWTAWGISAAAALFLVFVIFDVFRPMPDDWVIRRFTQIYWERKIGAPSNPVYWLGISSVQNPADNWVIQEIIYEVKPDFIIETGTYQGGTTLFYAAVLAQANPEGKIITVDIADYSGQAAERSLWRERVEQMTGSSIDPGIVRSIAEKVKGKKVIVTLDSDHSKEHVLRELELYAPLVSPGSYLVVQDTFYGGNPVTTESGEDPMAAVREFLKNHPEFSADREREKFLLTFYPSGYLKRVQ